MLNRKGRHNYDKRMQTERERKIEEKLKKRKEKK